MTPIEFKFVLPTGQPIANQVIDIQLSRPAHNAKITGISMPRPVQVTTDALGRATLNLLPSSVAYYLEVLDQDSDAGIFYKFIVPELMVPGTTVRLQDIVVDADMSNKTYDEAALLAIQDAKANTITAMLAAQASQAVAEGVAEDLREGMATVNEAIVVVQGAQASAEAIAESLSHALGDSQAAAVAAQASAEAAAGSATLSGTKAAEAGTKATEAGGHASDASTSAAAAAGSATASSASAGQAAGSATAASGSAGAAADSATLASTKAAEGAGYRDAAAASATTAGGHATSASNSASAAATSAETAATKAAAADSSATAASGSAAAAATSATAADGSKTAAAGSATTASSMATEAGTKAGEAAASATAAAGSATAAGTSATAAAGSASTASTKAAEAADSAAAAALAAAAVNPTNLVAKSGSEMTGKLGFLGDDTARIIESKNAAAAGTPASFFVEHAYASVRMGNLRGGVDISATDAVTVNGNQVWHAGNFTAGRAMQYAGWLETPGLNADTMAANRTGFSYSNGSPHTGPVVRFDSNGYDLQLSATYQASTMSFRTRNGDTTAWNPWRAIWHSGNFDPANYVAKTGATYVQATGLSGIWGATAGVNTGAFNAIMGTAGSASWLVTGSSGGTFRGGIQMLDAGGTMRIYEGANYMTFSGGALGVTGAVSASQFNGSGAGLTSVPFSSLSGLPIPTNWTASSPYAAHMLGWKNYGNGHVIFDASASTSPTGSAVNNTNPTNYWASTYPTLMGWNGVSTYGVRVDSSRISDSTAQTTFGNVVTNGVARGSYGSISIRNSNNSYSGIDFTEMSQTLMITATSQGFYRNNNSWDWRFDNGVLAAGAVPWALVSGRPTAVSQFTNDMGYLTSAGAVSKASTLAQGGGAGTGMTFNWAGQPGQPSWLWGGVDGVNHYVYNPANFSVAYAASAGSVPAGGNAARAWATFYMNSSTSAVVAASYGISSIGVVSAGSWQANFAAAMPDTNYVAVGSRDHNSGDGTSVVVQMTTAIAQSTTRCSFYTLQFSGGLASQILNQGMVRVLFFR